MNTYKHLSEEEQQQLQDTPRTLLKREREASEHKVNYNLERIMFIESLESDTIN